MSSEDFKARKRQDFARLLAQWRRVELWVKKAEQINKKALIPAINELRYASRQLFNALEIFNREELDDIRKKWIDKRISIAEQYLYNAEHDIADGIVTYYAKIVDRLECDYGRNVITSHYIEFPLFKNRIIECQNLIADARENYEKRPTNYRQLRENHYPHLIAANEALVEAEVGAKEEKERLNRELIIAKFKIRILELITIISAAITIISTAVAILT